jgi:small subunit ribosomal protein S6
MALYEHMLIARQDISAQAVDALATHLKTIIENEGGKVEKQEYWGLRTLAYRIKKNRKGHYVLLNLNAPANAIAELERQLKINEDVLRFLTVRVDAFEQSNSSRKREGEAREARERRPRDETTETTEGIPVRTHNPRWPADHSSAAAKPAPSLARTRRRSTTRT